MPKDLLYASFKDAPYTSQFVGSIHPELKEAQQVLNQTYDLSKESDSKLAAVARDMAQKAHPKDTQAAQALFEDYSAKLAKRAKAGNYERMLHETTNDARQFNVNAGKIVAEKQRVDNYIKQLDEDKTINDADKADLKKMALSGQNSLQYDKNQGLVVGEGFKGDQFASDVNFSKILDEGYAKGSIPDMIGGSGSRITTDKATGLPLLIDSKGKTSFVKKEDVEKMSALYLTNDPGAQGHIDRETRALAFDLGYQDWRNLPKPLYDKLHSQAAYNLTNNAIKAAGIKYGFTQTESDTSSKFLPKEYLASGKTLTPNPLKLPQTRVLTSGKGVEIPDLTIDDIKAAKSGGDYNKFLEEKGVPKLDRDRLGNDYRILSSKEPLANKIKSLSSSNPVIGSLVEAMTKAGANITEENLLAAYNSAQTLLKHKYPVAETFNEDFEKADRLGILGQDNIQNFPEATKAMMFTDPQTGERYSFNNLPLSKSLENESWLGRIGIGKHIKTIGDLIEKDPEKVIALKQQMSNPVRILPFGNPGGVGINIGGKFYTSTSPLTQEETVQNDAIYKLNAASYGLNGGSKIIDVNQSFLKPIFEQDPSLSGIQKVQAQRNPIVDAHGNLLGFKTDVYEINKNGLRTSNKPITTLDNINNLYRSHARTSTDAFNVKGTGEGGEDFNETKTESTQ